MATSAGLVSATNRSARAAAFSRCIWLNFTAKNIDFLNTENCANDRTIKMWNLVQLSIDLVRSISVLVSDNMSTIVYAVILVLILGIIYVLYKCYFSPVLIVKELTDVGFDHIKGPGRRAAVQRARQARRLGARLPPPYPNGWFALVESMELHVGDVKAVDALGENFCVFRDESGVARCVDAYCPHLGANMAIGGAVVGDCIECPFHKWRFSGRSGACVAVPQLNSPPRGVAVRVWHTCETLGAVWVWYDAGGALPAWSLPDPPELRSWGYRGRNEFTVSSHIQDIPENGADVAHLNAVHSPSVITKLGEKYPQLLDFVGRHVWSAEWTRNEDHTANMRLNHEYRICKVALGNIEINATQIGPGAVHLPIRTSVGPLLILQSVTPLGPHEQRVVHRVYSPFWNAVVAAAFVYGESAMFERDLVIWNSKKWVGSPAYVKTDKSVRAFRNWFSQFYSKESVSFEEALRKQRDPLDW